jgi:hypothetical protein
VHRGQLIDLLRVSQAFDRCADALVGAESLSQES